MTDTPTRPGLDDGIEIGIGLTPHEYAELVDAANADGIPYATLARTFIVSCLKARARAVPHYVRPPVAYAAAGIEHEAVMAAMAKLGFPSSASS